MAKVKALLADMDGTLVDTVRLIRHGHYAAAYEYLSNHGIPEAELPTYEQYEAVLNKHVGGIARETLERTVRAFYEATPHHLKGIDYDALHALLNPVQDRLAGKFIRAYEGLDDTLRWLARADIKLGIFTSGMPHHIVRNFGVSLPRLGLEHSYADNTTDDLEKLARLSDRMKEAYNLSDFTIVSGADITVSKPDPQGLNIAIAKLRVPPEACAALGDHSYDMQAARAAGVPIRIGITHGFDDRDTLQAAEATTVIDSLTELPFLLA